MGTTVTTERRRPGDHVPGCTGFTIKESRARERLSLFRGMRSACSPGRSKEMSGAKGLPRAKFYGRLDLETINLLAEICDAFFYHPRSSNTCVHYMVRSVNMLPGIIATILLLGSVPAVWAQIGSIPIDAPNPAAKRGDGYFLAGQLAQVNKGQLWRSEGPSWKDVTQLVSVSVFLWSTSVRN